MNTVRYQNFKLPLILETQIFRQTFLHHFDQLVASVPLRARFDPIMMMLRRSFDGSVNRITTVRLHDRCRVRDVFVELGGGCRLPAAVQLFVRRRRFGLAVATVRRQRLPDVQRHFDGSLTPR